MGPVCVALAMRCHSSQHEVESLFLTLEFRLVPNLHQPMKAAEWAGPASLRQEERPPMLSPLTQTG